MRLSRRLQSVRKDLKKREKVLKAGISARLANQGVFRDFQDPPEDEDLAFALLQNMGKTLAKIKQALRNIEEGTHGYCFVCEEEIAENRLKSIPFAVRCKDCEELDEIRQARERRSRFQNPLLLLDEVPGQSSRVAAR